MARFALLVAVLAAFLVTTAVCILFIPLLSKIEFEFSLRYFRSAAPNAHKKGVPTMGGLCLMVGLVFGVGLAWVGLRTIEPGLADAHQRYLLSLALCTTLAFGVIGFVDDILRLGDRNHGLRPWQRLAAQTVVATLFLTGLYVGGALDTGVVLPGAGYLDLGVWYYPLSYALILFFVNAVDLTDGPEGLSSVTAFAAMAGYLAVYGMLNYFQLAVFPAAVAGALLAFTLWSFAPARVLPGRTGGLLLGGAVVSAAYVVGWPGLLPLVGGVFLAEGVTLLAQWLVFKLGKGKRLLPAAPLHRALAARGWNDARITYALGAAGLVCALMAILFVRVS